MRRAAANRASMSSRSVSTQGRGNTPASPMIPSPYRPPMMEATSHSIDMTFAARRPAGHPVRPDRARRGAQPVDVAARTAARSTLPGSGEGCTWQRVQQGSPHPARASAAYSAQRAGDFHTSARLHSGTRASSG